VKELTDARKHYGIKAIRERFPVIDTIPGDYNFKISKPTFCKRMKIISDEHAMELGFGPRPEEKEQKLPTLTTVNQTHGVCGDVLQ
jgi:hypothetical protein